jgi:hypothetical protein
LKVSVNGVPEKMDRKTAEVKKSGRTLHPSDDIGSFRSATIRSASFSEDCGFWLALARFFEQKRGVHGNSMTAITRRKKRFIRQSKRGFEACFC